MVHLIPPYLSRVALSFGQLTDFQDWLDDLSKLRFTKKVLAVCCESEQCQ